ncbi:DENN domain-containing protein 5B-like isoform X1 [Daphnia pulex]|uniref:DENN domain-containing protein 5B-like isoform X1 n=1 Tax=Daphnia pulex TaxID=6669 RepID=UPI001EDCABDB|nr:DENN domain-containing protein 5B-like isoform X1 [Daphnia pulex]
MNSSTQVNNVFDYFVVCGLDSTRGLVPNNEHNALSGPLEATYCPQVLAHYPENVAWNLFDGAAVTTLCMPSGVHFSCVPKESHDKNKEPHFHPFIITKENGSRVYGFSLVFNEEVVDDSIINAVSSLQKMHAAQIVEIAPRSNLEVFEDPATSSKSLPRHFKVNSTRLYDKAKCTAKFDVLRDSLLVAKCICLIGQYPAVDAARNFLLNFYRLAVHSSELSTSGDHPLSMLSPESYIYYLLFSIPLPSPNQCIVIPNVPALEWTQSSTAASSTLIFQRPSVHSELPLFEYEIGQVIDLLGIDHLIQLWTCLLLETQVLIHSHDFNRLMLVAESLTTLLFPFSWPHVYVPILPDAMENFLDAPVPFLMGLRSLPSDDARIPSEANLCMVDIDNDRITIPEDLPSFPQHKELADELREVLTKLQQTPTTTHSSSSSYNKQAPNTNIQSSSSNKQRQSWSPMALASGSNASVLERSEAFQKISAIAKRTGVFSEDTKCVSMNGGMESQPVMVTSDLERYLRVQIVNNAIREIFLNQFAHMFSVYEYFFNQPNQDMDSWLSNRDQVHPFDKTTFLSDQPGPHLRFMSCFLESQMFANFIDAKVLANYGQYSHSVRVLDARIKLLKDGYGDSMVRTPGYEPCTWYEQTAALLERRLLKPMMNVVTPSEILTNMDERPTNKKQRTNKFYPGFPSLNNSMLTTAPCYETIGKKGEKSRRKEKPTLQKSYSIGFESSGIAETIRDSNNLAVPIAPRPAVIAQGNWKFVEQLLQECKTKTKRLLVGKMGSEAFELGHGQVSVSGVEDNTLIAGLCDLLERVWAHGLQTKQGKSALWSHILHYHDQKTAPTVNNPVKASSQAPAYAFVTLRKRLRNLSAPSYDGDGGLVNRSRTSHSVDNSRAGNAPNRMKPLPESLIFDMRNVQNMADIKTHLGYARAWVRLCLEKKLLYVHLTTLLSEESLLRTLYKRYAFLRCEDERNLFLTYLLTLNAADYHSFTHTYTNTVITYRVLIVQAKSNMSTCRPYLLLSGTLADTQALYFANDRLELLFQHKNLGILTTVRIGLEDQIGNSRWLIDHVIVRNEITGRAFKFPCGLWLGKDIEDGSTERLLVAAPYDCSTMCGSDLGSIDPSSHGNGSPAHNTAGPVGSRTRSPSATRAESSLTSSLTNLAGNLNINLKGAGTRRKFTESEMQCLLGEAVNNLIKYYLEPTGERGNVTALLCGESGLVPCLELVLHHGFRSSRYFTRNLYLWDYLLQVRDCYTQDPRSVTSVRDYADPSSDRPARRWLCDIIGKIQHYGHSLGKRDKQQLFLCLAARDRMLHRIIGPLASCSSTLTHYDENSYLRDKRLRDYLQPLLQTLSEEKVKIVLEASITRGID